MRDTGARPTDTRQPGPPTQQLPNSVARRTEIISLGGTLLSTLALVVALLFSTGTSRLVLAALAGVFLFLFAPTWIVGTYDAIRAGQRASDNQASRAEFWATWGLVGVVARLVARRRRRGAGETLAPMETLDNNKMQQSKHG